MTCGMNPDYLHFICVRARGSSYMSRAALVLDRIKLAIPVITEVNELRRIACFARVGNLVGRR